MDSEGGARESDDVDVGEMRMLRLMCGFTKSDRKNYRDEESKMPMKTK